MKLGQNYKKLIRLKLSYVHFCNLTRLFYMKRILTGLFVVCFSVQLFGQPKAIERPKLVVGIVVDQMRWDYLYRYYDRYSSDGFKRLLNDGFSCDQTMINYLPSFTAPGHTCVYTGSVPSIHGIAANDWIDNATGRHWYCTEDTTVSSLGGSRAAGTMSPRNLLASTITDELRLATNFQSRVFGIAIKDRGAILPAGHLANGAYWYDDSTGSFISSTYYGSELPSWLSKFNNKRLSDSFLRKEWKPLYSPDTYTQSLPDKNNYEGNFPGEKSPVFPHLSNLPVRYINLRKIPAGNTYTLAAAKACLNGEKLGQKDATDFLCVSLSSTDYIGHQFAPNSVEVEDTYLRLDRDLADFFHFLDNKVGEGNYLLFLTADHGGAHNAAYLEDIDMPAGNANEYKMSRDLKAFVKRKFNTDSLLRTYENYQVYFNEDNIKRAGVDRDELRKEVKEWFYRQAQVAYVIDMEDVDKTAVPEPIKTMAINGYNQKRSGSLQIVYSPGWYDGYARTGTTHGSWNPYDTHIPLLWYGWRIKSGSTNTSVHMEDIAATLAALLHVQMPSGCIGKPIKGLVR
jgi:predicted AlkP superfamily pyrophosphatase or phosphodiesterase